MSMRINSYGNVNDAKWLKDEQLKAMQGYKEKLQGDGDTEYEEKFFGREPVLKDEYISREEQDLRPSGLYRFSQNEKGCPKVLFEDPKKAVSQNQKESNGISLAESEKGGEKCSVNTDQVDREIKRLKEKKEALEQQIRMHSDDEKEVRELEEKLEQVERELSRKDNDTYRKQKAVVFEE